MTEVNGEKIRIDEVFLNGIMNHDINSLWE